MQSDGIEKEAMAKASDKDEDIEYRMTKSS